MGAKRASYNVEGQPTVSDLHYSFHNKIAHSLIEASRHEHQKNFDKCSTDVSGNMRTHGTPQISSGQEAILEAVGLKRILNEIANQSQKGGGYSPPRNDEQEQSNPLSGVITVGVIEKLCEGADHRSARAIGEAIRKSAQMNFRQSSGLEMINVYTTPSWRLSRSRGALQPNQVRCNPTGRQWQKQLMVGN